MYIYYFRLRGRIREVGKYPEEKIEIKRLSHSLRIFFLSGYHVPKRMAEEDGRKSRRSQNTQNTPGTTNLSRDGIEDVSLNA